MRTFDYAARWWRRWCVAYVAELAAAGIAPMCGASLARPRPDLSRCMAEGRIVGLSQDGTNLHRHHEPALTAAELERIIRGDRLIACDAKRIVLLCRDCHTAITPRDRWLGDF